MLTNVLRRDQLTLQEITRFYRMRWGIEVEFRGLKQTLDRHWQRTAGRRGLPAEPTNLTDSTPTSDTGDYCRAHAKLPETALRELTVLVADDVHRADPQRHTSQRPRISPAHCFQSYGF
jgi:hypothetical protein